MYENDVLAEEAILKWFEDKEEKFPEFGPKLRKSVKPFIDWLQEDDDESDSDE